MPVKRWNFPKANWSHYISLTNKLARRLPSPDSNDVNQVYQDFCNTINEAAKRSIPRGCRKNYTPCWDAECETLDQAFLHSVDDHHSSRTATALLMRLDKKRRYRWSEAVRNIDFSHSSRKAWSIVNNLTCRSRHSPCHCPISSNAIASQLIRNGKYEGADHESTLDSYLKKCLTFGGLQHHLRLTSLLKAFTAAQFATSRSKKQNQVKLRYLISSAQS